MSIRQQILALPLPARLAALFYLAHILCEPWIATSEGFLILAAISWFVALRKGQLRPVWSAVYLPMGLYILGSALSALFAPNRLTSMSEVSEIILFLGFPISLSLCRGLEGMRDLVWRLLVFVGSYAAAWALWQHFVLGWTDLDHRIRGPAAHVMTFSGIILVVSLALLARVAWSRQVGLLVPLGVIVLALTLTYTRGAWIGWAAGAAWIALSRKPKVALAVIPVLVIALIVAPLPLFGRLISVFDPGVSSNLDRIRMAQAGIEMVKDRPAFGNGPGNMEEIYPFYRLDDSPRFRTPHLHSNPVQIWAERGIMPFVAYHLLLIVIAVELWRRRHRNRAAADAGIAATIAFFVAGFTEYNFGDGEVLMTWLDVVAVSFAPLLIRQNESGPREREAPAVPDGEARGVGP